MIQLNTHGRRIEINGDNYHEFIKLINSINERFTQKGMRSELIKKDYENKAELNYFKMTTKLVNLNEKNWIMAHYLMTNNIRTAYLSVLNFKNPQDSDLEDFVKRTLMF